MEIDGKSLRGNQGEDDTVHNISAFATHAIFMLPAIPLSQLTHTKTGDLAGLQLVVMVKCTRGA